MINLKLSPPLNALVQNTHTDHIEVIIQLVNSTEGQLQHLATREEKIDLMKLSFAESMEKVSDFIQDQGGNVLSVAWLNKTMKALVPTRSIGEIANLTAVRTIDLPRKVVRE